MVLRPCRMAFFTVHVNRDEDFDLAFTNYVERGHFDEVEFVIGPAVSAQTYSEIRNRIVLNNMLHGRKDKIRNTRPLGNDNPKPRVTIRTLEELHHNINNREHNSWVASIPLDLPRCKRESLASSARVNQIDVLYE